MSRNILCAAGCGAYAVFDAEPEDDYTQPVFCDQCKPAKAKKAKPDATGDTAAVDAPAAAPAG